MQAVQTWRGASQIVNYAKVRAIGAWYVAEYRLLNMSKWWGAIVAFGLGSPVLYLTSVGLGIGALVDRNAPVALNQVSYLVFLAPALLATAAIQAFMDETMFPTLHGFVWAKVFLSMRNAAITPRQIADGVMIAAFLRALWTVLIYYLVMVAFGAVQWGQALWSLPMALLAAWGFGALMLAFAATLKDDSGLLTTVSRFVIAPMFMFSGTFYPLSNLPIYLQAVGWVSPLWHATELGRWLTYDYPLSVQMIFVHIGVLAVMGMIGSSIAYRLYEKRLNS